MTDIRDAEPQPPDDNPGYCCVAAGMHEGHDEDCAVGHEEAIRPLPSHYRPSRRLDGLYEIHLYNDDPAYKLAERFLEKHNFTALSTGKLFVGRPEDYAKLEAALVAAGKGAGA